MTKKNHGWKGIGRSLVLGTTGNNSILERLHSPNVVAIQLEGQPAHLVRRRTLAPDLLDAVVLDATGENREEVVELSRVLRGRYLASVLVLPKDAWGKRMFRSYLSVFVQDEGVKSPHICMAVSVAAQVTWTLAWLRLDRQPLRNTQKKKPKPIINLQSALLSKVSPQPARPSRTTPWAPPADLLVELTKAYKEQ